ncbi:MAG: TonB-dependent receptor [Rubrivivax sp.]|nr:TonB-dependent receptor [Rubrivivax sp.]
MSRKHLLGPVASAVASLVGLMAAPAWAQTDVVQRVEITGSSIKRITSEGALPVQVIDAVQIQRSGATSVADLIQKLPAMQGFQIADIAVGTNSGGIVTASIHDIGASYTLVLLNGRRIAPTGSGSTINLNAIPMSAIERIEVLTDGASALYGSDAIAGVVNFVLKRNQQGGTVTARVDVPTEGGGESANASITYGFGDLDKDRFSLVATYRHDRQKQLKATDRDFGQTAYLPFTHNGTNYIYDRTSTFAVPANATVTFNKLAGDVATLPTHSFNPYQKKTGQCAERNFLSLNNAVTATSITENCAFDFVSTIEIFPESERDSFYLSGQARLGDKVTMFSDVAFSRLDLTARIAPNPVPVAIPLTSTLYTTYVLPYLSAAEAARTKAVSASYRAWDFGTRDSQTITDSKHVVVGADAELGAWSLTAALTWSENAIDEKYVGGYFKNTEFRSMLANGQFDPFVPVGQQSAAAQTLIQQSIFNGTIRTSSTTLTGIDVRASGDLLKLPAGMMSLGVGGDFRNYKFKQAPSAEAAAGAIYNYAPVAAYDMNRDNTGMFAELLVPVVKGLEFTGALRYDRVTAVQSKGMEVGSDMDATTYKLTGRYQASSSVLLRGSYGTGFKAPAMQDIAQPLVASGVTASSYDCPFPNTPECKPGKLQYSRLVGGNALLKPEKSEQLTFGIRFEPTADFGIGADYWEVKIRDAVSAVSETQAFADPAKYRDLFTTYQTPAETQPYWAFITSSTNIGRAINRGIDWDVIGRVQTGIGRLTLGLTGTYLIESSYTRPGTDNDFTDSMGRYGENQSVSFRNIVRATATLDTGKLSNTLTLKYRSGYTDIKTNARNLTTNKNELVTLKVPEYSTLDWVGVYSFSKALELKLGVKNLLNKAPPLTLRDSSGHQVGYDPRYADPFMRTVYVEGRYSF